MGIIDYIQKEKNDRNLWWKLTAVDQRIIFDDLLNAFERSPYDISPCTKCERPVVTVPVA